MITKVLGKNINYQLIEQQWIDEGRDLIVFLHEGLGSIPQWKNFPKSLSERLQLPALVYERVGYGQSDPWMGPLGTKFLHFEGLIMLPELLKALGFKNSIFIFGHSDGGTIGLIQSSEAMPELLGAIIEAPHIMLEQHSLAGIAKARTMLNNPEILKVLDRYHQGRAANLIDTWSSHWLKANTKDWDATQELRKIKTPLLLIQGDNDEFGTYEQIDRIAREAQSTLIEVAKLKDCGHIPHLQQTEKVLELCETFVQQIKNQY